MTLTSRAIVRQRKTWTQDKFIDDSNRVWWVHKRVVCTDSFCAIHNPSVHPLDKARMIVRSDAFKYGLIERICEHGIGHSDPDSVAFYDSVGEKGMGVHGCDGCCTGNYEEVQDVGLYIPTEEDYDYSSAA